MPEQSVFADHQFLEDGEARGVRDGGWGWATVAVDFDHDQDQDQDHDGDHHGRKPRVVMISLDGATGEVMAGEVRTTDPELSGDFL